MYNAEHVEFFYTHSFLMWVFDKWSPYSYQNNMEKYKDDDEKRFFNFKECLWFCMTSLTPQVRPSTVSTIRPPGWVYSATVLTLQFLVHCTHTS